jgi:hypothetical protein
LRTRGTLLFNLTTLQTRTISINAPETSYFQLAPYMVSTIRSVFKCLFLKKKSGLCIYSVCGFPYHVIAKWLIYFKNLFGIQTIRNNPDFSIFGILNQQWHHWERKNLWGVTDSTITYREPCNDACSWNINYILLPFNLMLKWKFLFKLPVIPVAVVGIAGEREEINNKVSCQYLHSVPKNALWKRKKYCLCLQNATRVKPHVNLSKRVSFSFSSISAVWLQISNKYSSTVLFK